MAPPVVELGRLAGWSPLPLSVRDARRSAGALRARLTPSSGRRRRTPAAAGAATWSTLVAASPSARLTGALADVDLAVHAGEVVAVMGRNGAGKSTLLRSMVGMRRLAPAR